ncbi:GtrA family protein [Pararobbsia alpina]|uniref:GtrA family protein n=1 Tax=Pararobbsia alpina TaxID=621374 RepID=UPI0039A6CD3F
MRFIPQEAESWLRRVLDAKQARYLIVGAGNTAFGYGVTVGLYYLLVHRLHIVAISLIANVISITFSFVTYKVFVFRTHGKWLQEYLRAYVVYGFAALLSTALLWLLVNFAGIPMWIAQGVVILLVVILSYLGHNFFTFSRKQ